VAHEDLVNTHQSNSVHFDEHQHSVAERLEFIERVLGDSAAQHDQHVNTLREHASRHDSVLCRVETLETTMSDNIEKIKQEIGMTSSNIEKLHEHICAERSAREQHAERVEFIEQKL